MKRFKLRKSLAFNIIGYIVILLVVFSVLLSIIGYFNFTNSFSREYTETGCRIASTAVTLVDGNKIDQYFEKGESDPEYQTIQKRMDTLCYKMDIAFVYVIKVDTSDYNSFVSVFDSVNENQVDFERWELGYERKTTNDTYKKIYKDIYENGLEYGTILRTTQLERAEPHITIMLPVKNSEGEVTAVLCIQRLMRELVNGRKPYLKSVAVTTALLCVIVSAVSFYYVRRHFITPVRMVTKESDRFAREKSAPEQPLDEKISKINEISILADSINKMEYDMLRYMDGLTTITAEKERIGTELGIAHQIQIASVPSIFPAYSDRSDFDIYASMTPAKEVGGDFYDFFLIDDDHLGLVMADVSGKGVPAALFMMITKILIKERALMGGTPSEILSFVNDRICENNKVDMFVTVWLGILEISTGTLTAANAGHEDPAICRKGGDFKIEKNKHGLVVGGMSGMKYRDFEIQLNPGDKIFLYTDGVPEATNINNEMFTLDGMINSLNKCKDKPLTEILQTVWNDATEFTGEAPQFDDLTMMCLEMKEKADMKKLTVKAQKENLHRVMDFTEAFLEECGCSPKTMMQFDLCVEEIFVNIANYAYKTNDGDAEIQISETDGEITLTFIDSGMHYDPLKKADPDITLSAVERQIGGLGIFLVKKNMDSVNYRRDKGKNILTLKKKIR